MEEMRKHRGGVIHSPEDPRDYRISKFLDLPPKLKVSGSAVIPSSHECWIPETIKDQGPVNSCTAFAMSTILTCIYKKLTGEEVDFSTGFLYGNRRVTDWKDEGEIMRDVAKKTHQFGDVQKTTWDSNCEVPTAIVEFEKVYPEIAHLASKLISGYVKLYDKDEVKSFMCKYDIPLFASLPMNKICPLYNNDGLHAVTLFKYSQFGFTCVNSWGKDDVPFINEKKFTDFDEIWGIVPMETIKKYDDVKDSYWAKQAIDFCTNNGYMNGYPDGNFHPDEPLTRAQMAAIIERLKSDKQ